MADERVFNREQKEAVNFGQGPLLIIAGAGTGKTTVITERIKHLILEENVSPEEILALTFTEKASHEMEERIDKIMPYGYTQLWISTFHAFCDKILRQEAIQFGLDPSFKLMTETESVLFLRKNIFKLKLEYFRPLGNPTKFLEAMLSHFSRLNDEDITPDEYCAYAESLLKNISQEGLSTEEALEKKEEAQKIHELAFAYTTYEKMKIEEGFLDFSNMIALTLKLFRTRKHILKQYQEKFKYILVDEFQDTNFAQNELAILLSGKSRNITVVADDDQAIYRWRGAALSNLIQFRTNFPGTKIVTLSKNYRSTQEILDRSYQMIQHNNPNRLEALENINKKLTSERKVHGEKIEFIHTRQVDEEAEHVALKIQELIAKQSYTYSDFAILVRANSHAQPFTYALERAKIPFQFLGPGHLFQEEDIKDVIAYLKVLYSLDDSISLFRVLTMEHFQIPARDTNLLVSSAKKNNISLFRTLEQIDESDLSDDTKEKIKTLTEMIGSHLALAKKESAGQILYTFLVDTGIFEKLSVITSAVSEQQALNMAKLFDKIKAYEALNPEADIYSLVDWIDLMMEMGDSPLISDMDWREANAVNILTVHSSKGLEFPVVFLVNLIVDRFPSRERAEKLPIPQNLIKEILPPGDYHMQEERRLFYVAMTRARDKLYMHASAFYSEGKRERKVSPFVYEALPEELAKSEKLQSAPIQLTLAEVVSDYEKKEEHEESVPYARRLQTISYSQLQTFDICPLHYKARYVLNLPSITSASQSFGNSIHQAFDDFYKTVISGTTPTEEDFTALLKKHWISQGYTEKSHEEYAMQKGIEIVKNYYQNHFDISEKPLSVEMPFSYFLKRPDSPNGMLRVTGKIDRIDTQPHGKIEIIDYKTGKPDKNQMTSYRFQLGIYALGATKIKNPLLQKQPEDITVSLLYLETGDKISIQIKEKDLIKTEEKILDKVSKIEKSDYMCSKSILCGNCEYKMLCNINS